MRSIGEMARDCGLSVSALRFYDRAGVLVPAWVDPASGYRWYEPAQLEEARLLARLRRAGMPLADIRLVLVLLVCGADDFQHRRQCGRRNAALGPPAGRRRQSCKRPPLIASERSAEQTFPTRIGTRRPSMALDRLPS